MGSSVIYTIGHSTHSLEYFLELLNKYSVNCLIDVRSIAASAFNPQYNKEPLASFLKKNNVSYLHLGDEFGARHTDLDLLDEEGKVDFEKVRKSWNFKNGVERLCSGIEKGYIIALMCSESDPFACHRFSMISIALEQDGFSVIHILKDKTTKTNKQLENQLLKKYEKKLPKATIFEPDITPEVQLKAAYRLRNKDVAYSPYSKELVEKYD